MKKYIAGKQITVNNNTVGKYKCFVPSFLNRQYVINDSKILVLVEQVAEVLGKLGSQKQGNRLEKKSSSQIGK